MKRSALFAACCLLAAIAACRKKEPEPKLPPPNTIITKEIDFDQDNLLNLAHGASVVSRTGEVNLENSAAHAIDGDWTTVWKSAPGGPEQTFVFSLAARSRIDRLGVITPASSNEYPPHVRFEASNDGTNWRDVGTIDVKPQRDPQIVSVAPFEATYLRVRTEGLIAYYSTINSVIAKGVEVAPPVQPPIEGCWTINGMPSRFVQRGTSVSGVIGSDPPMYVSGDTNGRIIRLMWRRGPQWGHALVTLDPQRRALSGVRWHEQVQGTNVGDGWFGKPSPCVGPPPSAADIVAAIQARAVRSTITNPTNETQRVFADGVALHAR